jgi:hypothetical protein
MNINTNMKIQPQKNVGNKHNDEPKHKDGHLTPQKKMNAIINLRMKTNTNTNKQKLGL